MKSGRYMVRDHKYNEAQFGALRKKIDWHLPVYFLCFSFMLLFYDNIDRELCI